MDEIDFVSIEKKWQKTWEEKRVFEISEDSGKEKFYVLEMFPYPSGAGLHMGHALNYTIGDILARFKIMKGFNVLHPMGFDALGLPAENAAIKAGVDPEKYTNDAIENFVKQQRALGVSYDWSRMVNTANSEYYKWDQWIFLKMLEKGLAYQKEASVNWCPKCDTVLANEQVNEGKCWRHEDTDVEVRKLRQWFFRTTEYAEELLNDLERIDWPERTKTMQRNWIGRSEGTEISFEISGGEPQISQISTDKVILVDAVHCLVDEKGNVNQELKNYLDSLPNRKIVLTMAPKSKFDLFFGKVKDYEIFTTEFNPKKSSPKYYEKVLEEFNLKKENVVYFEHSEDGVDSAKSLGIDVVPYNGDVKKVKEFIDSKIKPQISANARESGNVWKVFTTRPDTIFGVTFMVVAAGHDKLDELVTNEQRLAVDEYLRKMNSVSEKDIERREKEGVFSGSYAVNPANGERVPIWIGNFVLADYGSGMVMGVPAHDKRDFEFAKKYGISVRQVVTNKDPLDFKNRYTGKEAFVDDGVLMASKQFSGMSSLEAKTDITNWLAGKGNAKRVVNFKLRDWGVSRQRYWGTPIPIVYCDGCGAVPVPEKDLPVVLPKEVKFGKGNPLETNSEWLNCKCPKCGGKGRRESDTMDTFVNSSWYFLRYADPKNSKKIFDFDKVKYWNPVDVYIGGAEHACMHLLYSRFYVKFLRDIGALDFDEPFLKLFHQGMLHAEDGRKMSKSLGNVVEPIETMKKYGVDATRWFLISVASPDKDFDWSEKGILGATRFIKKVFEFYDSFVGGKDSEELVSKLNLCIKNIGNYYDSFEYRKATIEIRELFGELEKGCSKDSGLKFLKLIAPICPHVAEELWEKIGEKGLISVASWPKVDEKVIKNKGQKISGEGLNEKIVERIKGILKSDTKKVYVYVMPFEIGQIDKEKILRDIRDSKLDIREVAVFAVNDSTKIDPAGRANKAKPGMASIYLE
ncbi:HAD-IA family hydrolase [Candidatus Pacearchaeota archaeon]|nr:HAD-IA family hydrolase [Candidatus Pacearchaeota archaeon]